jgi:glycosyltransferase involved in cell wall biosynthesis
VRYPVPIAFVMTSFEPGGTERQMIELARRLDPARWTIHIACFHARGTWFSRAAEAAASVAEFPVTSFRHFDTLCHVAAFACWCRRQHIAVVHTTELYSNIFGLPGAALARVPARIANRREINPDKSLAQITLQRAAYACATRVVANSRAAADRLAAERVPAARISVIPNGLDLPRYEPRPEKRQPRKVVMVANLRPEKGHDLLIDAAAQLLTVVPDATFEIIGGGPELVTLLTRADAAGVGHAFNFLGPREDVAARLAAADIFVLPSRSEAFPNAVLEAMGAGLPIVATRVGGIPELIDDDKTGLLVPPGDARALADALQRLMASPTAAARLGGAAQAVATARYSFTRMVAAFDALYVTELARHGAGAVAQPQPAAS